MEYNLFIDTSGFFSILVNTDSKHHAATKIIAELAQHRRKALTSNFVIDETFTLLKARNEFTKVQILLDIMEKSNALVVKSIDENLFSNSISYFLQHADKQYSFTDCTSFLLMKEYKIRLALSTDKHFFQAGFSALLKDKG